MTYFPDMFHRLVDGENTALNDFDLSVARGGVYGISNVDVRGKCSAVSTSLIEVWENGTEYRFLTGAVRLSLSSSAGVDAFGSSGSRTVHIDGLGVAFESYSETINLSGSTVVQTSGSFLRVNHVHVSTAGALGGNYGDIRVHGGNFLLSLMVSGSGHDSNAVYTVPSGSTAYVRGVYCNTGKDATVRVRAAYRVLSGGLHTIRDIENYRTHQRFDLPFLPELPAGTDLIFSTQKIDGGATTATVTCGALLCIVADYAGTR